MSAYDIITKTTRFWSYLIIYIPSLFCSLFVLYHFLFDRTLRHALNNHVFVVIVTISLLSQVTYYPWRLYQLRLDTFWIRPRAFCTISAFINQTFFSLQIFLFAWASVERHILIFNDRLMKRRNLRFLLHYLPLIVVLGYCLIFYSYTFFYPPCQNYYYNSYEDCIWPCLWLIREFTLCELYLNQLLPISIIIIFSILLIIRVIRMKMALRQPNHWHRNLKMTIQLLTSISIFVLLVLPYEITLIIIYSSGVTDYLLFLVVILEYLFFFAILITPFTCILTSNELRNRFIDLLKGKIRQGNQVVPLTLATFHQSTTTRTKT